MSLGAPSITTPNQVDLRALQSAVINTRRRIEIIEGLINSLSTSSGTSSTTAAILATLQAQIAAIPAPEAANAALTALMAGGDGLVVHSGAALIVRTLQAGANITITYPDGVLGNPLIAATVPTDLDGMLYDDTGRVFLTDAGREIFTGA
jgi:hypothetical protein